MSAAVGTLATWLGGTLVDLPWLTNRKYRAIVTFVIIALMNSATWIWAVIIQNEYRHTKPVLDWGNQSSLGRGFGLYLFECISLSFVEHFDHWCIGNFSDSPGDQIRYSSLLRGIETAAVAVGVGVQAVPTALTALPLSYYATLKVVRKIDLLEVGKKSADRSDRVTKQDVAERQKLPS